MISPAEAAQFIINDYDGIEFATMDKVSINGTEARIFRDQRGKYGCVVTGSNERRDWLRNLLTKATIWSVTAGYTGREYASGAILGAGDLWGWLQKEGIKIEGVQTPWIKLIDWYAGHSRGGTIAAIVGASAKKRTITFGAYRAVRRDQPAMAGDELVINYVIPSDWVTGVAFGHERNGLDIVLAAVWTWPWTAHRMERYARYLGVAR